MNARFLVLGVLHRGNFHPYEIKRRLEAAMVECYIAVDVGTLYYAVRQLEKEGLIEAVVHERVARGGMRTVYAITHKGRSHFSDALHRQFEIEGPVSATLYGALLFLHLADPEKIKACLRARIAHLDELIVKLAPIRDDLAPRIGTGGEHLLCHIAAQRELDRKWLTTLLSDIETNGIRDLTKATPAAF